MSAATLLVCDSDDCHELYTTDELVGPDVARALASLVGWTYRVRETAGLDIGFVDRCSRCSEST